MINKSVNRMRDLPYKREAAVQYAHKWAYSRNDMYLDFEDLGGDCTNFASQCIFAGSGVMNYMPVYGWYYTNSYNRTAAWTGVNYLYNFLVANKGAGPYAELVGVEDVRPGDIAQLSFAGGGVFNHSPVVVKTGYPVNKDNILIAAHTFNTDFYPLTDFTWVDIRYIHMVGVRQ